MIHPFKQCSVSLVEYQAKPKKAVVVISTMHSGAICQAQAKVGVCTTTRTKELIAASAVENDAQ